MAGRVGDNDLVLYNWLPEKGTVILAGDFDWTDDLTAGLVFSDTTEALAWSQRCGGVPVSRRFAKNSAASLAQLVTGQGRL